MSALYAWPPELKWRDAGVALTFVVPAKRCNLSCSFCAIGQRGEAAHSALTSADYVHFVEDIVAGIPTAMVSIQGYEPLLDESWNYTKAILDAGWRLGLPRSLVTNGICLEDRAANLAACDPTGVTVSIDSACQATHDRLRGKSGALEQTLRGIRELGRYPAMFDRMTVSSVLLPRRSYYLHDMPEFLADLNVRHWAISPYLKIGTGSIGGPTAPSGEIIDAVLDLHKRALQYGIDLVLDDELGRLKQGEEYGSMLIRRFERPDGLVRLSPSGACAIGSEILRTVNVNSPRWIPGSISPSRFLAELRGRQVKYEQQDMAA